MSKTYSDYDWVEEGLSVGAAPADASEVGPEFDVVIDLRPDQEAYVIGLWRAGKQGYRLPFNDPGVLPPVPDILAILDIAVHYLREGKSILVHCQGGISRSPLVTAMILTRRDRQPLRETMQKVKEKHDVANVNPVLWAQAEAMFGMRDL